MTIALNHWHVASIVLAGMSAAVVLLIVIAPWRSIRREHPLDDRIESRILLGDDPAAIAEDEHRKEEEELEEVDGPGSAA
jgi:sensor histidine kinase regulating citrate/malate metabolism